MASERASGVRCGFVAPAHLLASGIARLPQAWVLALGRIATAVLWPLLGKRRRHAATNLALCFPELDERARARLLRATVRATVTVKSVDLAKARAVLDTVCSVDGQVVIEGEATVMTTSSARRQTPPVAA